MAINLKKIIGVKYNLENVLDNLEEGIIAHDLNRKIFFFNRTGEKITGFKREEVIGRDCHDAFEQKLCGEQCSFCGNTLAPFNHKMYPVHILTKDDRPKRLEMSVVSMKDENDQIVGVLASIRDTTRIMELERRLQETQSFAGIIGRDEKMLQFFDLILDLAHSDCPVLILGETGTGKELFANAIHGESRRAGRPFIPVNCGALPENILESELLGHVRGSFTGAIRDKKGRFEMANGGTIFLDEVADLTPQSQVKLLRVLQEGTFERVGGEKTIKVDVRVISATNKDLKKEVEKGTFRQDLYYRLCVVPIILPPLRERRNDIPILAEHFLKNFASKNGRQNIAFSPEALVAMLDYPWPGNVRELQNAILYTLVKCKRDVVEVYHLPPEITARSCNTQPDTGRESRLDVFTVKLALKKTGGNKAQAARLLGVGRATLYRFIAREGLNVYLKNSSR
ncbi:MAG: sigma 54-interacting transcriptional regulator [Firmicutes bacterium]|nr:sigma 54-interacting transcriptional regulator [Bacillota bacterium]